MWRAISRANLQKASEIVTGSKHRDCVDCKPATLNTPTMGHPKATVCTSGQIFEVAVSTLLSVQCNHIERRGAGAERKK
jgi:hypothetical protein